MDKRTEQVSREREARQAALGERLKEAEDGYATGLITKRFINASVGPVAERLKVAGEAYLAGDMDLFCSVLDSPVFELRARTDEPLYGDGSRSELRTIFKWFNDGSHGPDVVLAGLGTAVVKVAGAALKVQRGIHREGPPEGVFLTGLLGAVGEAARETCLGQFFQDIQGAEALAKITLDRKDWSRRNKLRAIAGAVSGQVRQQFEAEARGEITLEHVGTRTVMHVLEIGKDGKTRARMWKGRRPTLDDWDMLAVARRPKGEQDPHRPAWMTFALAILCAAQVEHGWFDLARGANTRWRRGAHTLVLGEEASERVQEDLDKWLHMGFIHEPMVVEPEKGDYLTVKHNPIAGRRGPMGWRTEVSPESPGWELASEVMAKTPWKVDRGTLEACKEGSLKERAAESFDGDAGSLREVLAQYSREAAHETIYFPIYMDFRGRIYPRPTWVTYQGTDVQKGLLTFTHKAPIQKPIEAATLLHLGNLYGRGMDKARLGQREEWWESLREVPAETVVAAAEEPVQMHAALGLIWAGQEDAIPCQIDGTCNGLQHLTALFRDELAAPFVNLVPSTLTRDEPADLYGEVARLVMLELEKRWRADWEAHTWIGRVLLGGILVDRKVCKGPVMVLPYGGTYDAILKNVSEACLAQEPHEIAWKECRTMRPDGKSELDSKALHGNYLAFRDRTLPEHPLFHSDMKALAGVVLEAIKRTIPRAMGAMDVFKQLALKVGDRSLEWWVPAQGIWVVHAYPESSRSTLKTRGFHLPGSVRGLQMRTGKDEIDRHAHRTGIVANFIHSQDAAHLVATMGQFRLLGGKEFGAIHDCFVTRPSQMGALGVATREAFRALYHDDPLAQPVRMRSKGGLEERFGSWYALAEHMAVAFPDKGTWQPEEVRDAAWFFS